jgi:hypothetical protein
MINPVSLRSLRLCVLCVSCRAGYEGVIYSVNHIQSDIADGSPARRTIAEIVGYC